MNEFEQHLREIVEVYGDRECPWPEWMKRMEKTLERARMFIARTDACQFKWENGAGCGEKIVRESYGIPCCEYHAKLRDRSFA